jgi:exosortase F-associated protein
MDDSYRRVRYLLAALACFGLAVIYVMQYTDFLYLFTGSSFNLNYHFIVNRVVRVLINDLCMLVLIYSLFHEKGILKLALAVQAVDLLVLLPLYFILKLPTEGVSEISSPFLSQLHRLIVNPTLMILLIPALYYQRIKARW